MNRVAKVCWRVCLSFSLALPGFTLAKIAMAGTPLGLLPLLPSGQTGSVNASEKGYSATKGQSIPYPSLLLYEKKGDADTAVMGYSVDGGRDVNGDGTPDFIVGAPLRSPGGIVNAGSAYVYSGLDGSLLYQVNGTDSGDVVGVSVAMLGDVNGDGRSEFIIGAPYDDPGGQIDAGTAYVYSGLNGSLLQQKDGAVAGDNFGWSVARAGIVNADAIPDYIIGAPYADSGSLMSAGAAYVYSGAGGGLLYRKFGQTSGSNFGYSVAGVGNVNGDARSDFIVGAQYADSNRGAAYVFSGLNGDTLRHVTGDTSIGYFGFSVAGVGDVNGDGRADFAVGAPYEEPGGQTSAGSAYIYSGMDGGLLRRIDGDMSNLVGYSVAGAGDINQDGKDDVIIGAPGIPGNGFQTLAGGAMIYSVMDGTLLHQSLGPEDTSAYGFAVGSAGDLNGDGRPEFIIGAVYQNVDENTFAGSAVVRSWGASEEVTGLSDVGNDQGKQLRIEWSNLPGNDGFIQEFAIYRRVDGGLKSGAVDPYNLKSTPPGEWDFVKSVPARGDSTYSTVVPTLRDSTISEGIWWTAFFVSGIGENPVDHFDSPVDSGYSLDNLAPAPPSALFAAQAGPDIDLDWKSTSATDFDYYWVYRDTVPGFTVAPEKRIGSTSDTSFVDNAPPSAGGVYYKVSAVDFSGNEGSPSIEATASACACACAHDPQCDGVTNIFDVTFAINVAFRGGAAISDPSISCPWQTTDVDCNGVTSIFDVTRLINVAFRGGDPATEFCVPCD